jgi:hypothetical protein
MPGETATGVEATSISISTKTPTSITTLTEIITLRILISVVARVSGSMTRATGRVWPIGTRLPVSNTGRVTKERRTEATTEDTVRQEQPPGT